MYISEHAANTLPIRHSVLFNTKELKLHKFYKMPKILKENCVSFGYELCRCVKGGHVQLIK